MKLSFTFLALLNLILLTGCEKFSPDLEGMIHEYYNPKFHENGVDQKTEHNAMIGRQWMDEVFYDNYPMEKIQLPHGCTNFDRIFHVSTFGSDANDGRAMSPFATVQKAIDLANNNECTKIKIQNGQYRQTIKLARKKNIAIIGENRITTQLLSKKILKGWEYLDRRECSVARHCNILKLTIDGNYSNRYHLLYKDKVSVPMWSLARYSFREVITSNDLKDSSLLDEAEYIDGLPNIIISDDLAELSKDGKEHFKKHVIQILATDTRSYKYMNSGVMDRNDLTWKGVGSAYYVDQGFDKRGNPISTIYFKAFDNDESAYEHISTHLGYSAYINDSQNIVIQNLSLYNGRFGLSISRDSHHIKAIGNLFSGHYRSVYIHGSQGYGQKIAPSHIEVYGNQITNNLDMNMSPQFAGAYRNFNLVKKGLSDAHGVYLYNVGANVDVHHNFIYNAGNGVQSFNDNKEDYQTIDLKVHHNLIINTLDDGIEPGGTCINCRWYSNHLRNTSQSLRIKIRDRNSIGPVFIYNNVFYNQDKYDYKENLAASNQTNIFYHTASNVPIYIYNNTFLGFRCFLMPTRDSATGAPNLYFLNNIFSCKYSMPNARLGAWPNPIAVSGAKNEHPIYSHNWIGGVQDKRKSVISSSGNLRTLYQTEWLHTFADDNEGNPLNYVYRAQADATPVHIFDDFNTENSHVLRRINFCPQQSPFSEIINGGINLNKSDDLHWQFIDEISYSGGTIYHQINRKISHDLPTDIETPFPIGFYDIKACKDFQWLLKK